MKSGYLKVLHCSREGPEGTVYDLLEAMFEEIRALQRSQALLQKAESDNGKKLDDVLAQRKKPKVEIGYRS